MQGRQNGWNSIEGEWFQAISTILLCTYSNDFHSNSNDCYSFPRPKGNQGTPLKCYKNYWTQEKLEAGKTKFKLYKSVARSVHLYECKTWEMTTSEKRNYRCLPVQMFQTNPVNTMAFKNEERTILWNCKSQENDRFDSAMECKKLRRLWFHHSIRMATERKRS